MKKTVIRIDPKQIPKTRSKELAVHRHAGVMQNAKDRRRAFRTRRKGRARRFEGVEM